MKSIDDVALSKAVSHALRHEPWLYELEVDEEGWVDLDALVGALRTEKPDWRDLSRLDVERMVGAASKQRHEIREGRIRALYGHSLPGRLRRVAAVPPVRLFHGTSPEVKAAILRDGLRPMGRQYVHLSVDETTALEVGRRKAREPVLLIVAARDAHDEGIAFYEGNEKVWLADAVPASFVRVAT